MIIPIRCFTCGKIIGNKYTSYCKLISTGESSDIALNNLGIKRYCCRKNILTNVQLLEKIIKY